MKPRVPNGRLEGVVRKSQGPRLRVLARYGQRFCHRCQDMVVPKCSHVLMCGHRDAETGVCNVCRSRAKV